MLASDFVHPLQWPQDRIQGIEPPIVLKDGKFIGTSDGIVHVHQNWSAQSQGVQIGKYIRLSASFQFFSARDCCVVEMRMPTVAVSDDTGSSLRRQEASMCIVQCQRQSIWSLLQHQSSEIESGRRGAFSELEDGLAFDKLVAVRQS